MSDPLASHSFSPRNAQTDQSVDDGTGGRRRGLSNIGQGVVLTLLGVAGLWISFRFGDDAHAILGAGPLIGGAMVGYGATQALFGERLTALRWVMAVVTGMSILGLTIVLLDTVLGVTVA